MLDFISLLGLSLGRHSSTGILEARVGVNREQMHSQYVQLKGIKWLGSSLDNGTKSRRVNESKDLLVHQEFLEDVSLCSKL